MPKVVEICGLRSPHMLHFKQEHFNQLTYFLVQPSKIITGVIMLLYKFYKLGNDKVIWVHFKQKQNKKICEFYGKKAAVVARTLQIRQLYIWHFTDIKKTNISLTEVMFITKSLKSVFYLYNTDNHYLKIRWLEERKPKFITCLAFTQATLKFVSNMDKPKCWVKNVIKKCTAESEIWWTNPNIGLKMSFKILTWLQLSLSIVFF